MVAHLTPEKGILSSLTPYASSDMVEVGNGSTLPVANIGSLRINTHAKPLTLKSVLHVPQLKHSFLSIRHLRRDNNCHVVFNGSFFCEGQHHQ